MTRDDNELFSPNDWSVFLVRITIAIVLFPHGAQKLLGWWDGAGYNNTMQFFTDTVGLPYLIGVLVILIEFFCPLVLLFGIATRYAAGLVMAVMVGIIVTVQHDYFFMNWFGNQEGEGMEFFLLMIALCCVLILNGGGRISFELLVTQRRRARSTSAGF